MKTIALIPIFFLCFLFQSCEEDAPDSTCIEGTVLGPVCPFGAGYLGYTIQVKDSLFGAFKHYDSTSSYGYILAALNLPEPYRNQQGQKIFFTARKATPEETDDLKPQTANCIQPPIIVIESVKSTCLTTPSE